MQEIQNAQLAAFSGERNDYGSLGFIRCLGIACNGTLIEDETEWRWFHDMSPGLKKRLISLGIYEFADAEMCRRCLSSALSLPRYSLSDLVVFVCLLGKRFLP